MDSPASPRVCGPSCLCPSRSGQPPAGRAAARPRFCRGGGACRQSHAGAGSRGSLDTRDFAITCSGDVPLPFLLKDRFKEKGFDCISSAHADFAKPGVPF